MIQDTPSVKIHLRPYDSSQETNLTMYDHLPYDRDLALCNRDSITLVSGNIIKYYRCSIEEPYEVDNRDKAFSQKLTEYRKQKEAAGKPHILISDEEMENGEDN